MALTALKSLLLIRLKLSLKLSLLSKVRLQRKLMLVYKLLKIKASHTISLIPVVLM
jgi:hypothetical protein